MDLALRYEQNVVHVTQEKPEFKPRRGDIYLARISITKEQTKIQNGIRPVILISNYRNLNSSTLYSCIPITSKNKASLPTHIFVGTESGLLKPSVALAEQAMPLDKEDLIHYVGHCPYYILDKIDNALKIQFQLEELPNQFHNDLHMENNCSNICSNESNKGDNMGIEKLDTKEFKDSNKEKMRYFNQIIGAINELNILIYEDKMFNENTIQRRDNRLKELCQFCLESNLPYEKVLKQKIRYYENLK